MATADNEDDWMDDTVGPLQIMAPLDALDTLSPYPDPTEAPTPIPSSKIPLNGLAKSSELVDGDNKNDKDGEEDVHYDGPPKTGKTLKDLATDLGAPESWGTLIDEMQEAVIGIIGDLVNTGGERTSLVDIIGHENRFRGIGALCILVALVGLSIDALIGSSVRVVESS